MNSQQAKDLFRDQFEQLAEASVREGTVIVDQIIDPIVLLNMPLYEQVDDLLQQAALPYGEASTTELLDLVGQRFFTERVRGSRARTSVAIVLGEPVRLEVTEEARFFTQDRRAFRPRQSSTFLPSQISERGDGTYITPQVEVVAVEEGGEYDVSAGEIQVTNLSNPQILRVTNPTPSSSGGSGETDEEYYQRIRRSISSHAMDTPRGLLYTVGSRFAGEIDRITMVGAGDPEMTRDVQRVVHSTREVPLDVHVTVSR
jgi:hypothetical protein